MRVGPSDHFGETYFPRYCLPLYQEAAEHMGEDPAFVHMDGYLGPLWQAIRDSEVHGPGSLSPPPDNDTSLGETLLRWPQMRAWVSFLSSVHLQDD